MGFRRNVRWGWAVPSLIVGFGLTAYGILSLVTTQPRSLDVWPKAAWITIPLISTLPDDVACLPWLFAVSCNALLWAVLLYLPAVFFPKKHLRRSNENERA